MSFLFGRDDCGSDFFLLLDAFYLFLYFLCQLWGPYLEFCWKMNFVQMEECQLRRVPKDRCNSFTWRRKENKSSE